MTKVLNNIQIADLLRNVAAAYKLQNEKANRFKTIAYERAADAVEHLSSEAKDLWDEGKLEEVSGIGTSIASHLSELFKTGISKHFDEILSPLPQAMFTLMKLPGIGPKTGYRLASDLKISPKGAIKTLERHAKKNVIAGMEGFGEQSQREILNTIAEYRQKPASRMLLPYAQSIAQEIIEYLVTNPKIKRADPLGSLRRRASTVGDIDISAACDDAKSAIAHFVAYPKKSRILEQGDRKAAILLPGNVHVDLLVHDVDAYGATLQHFTGSKHHNVALREYALKKGLSVSDYGIKDLKKNKDVVKKFDTEESFYNFLGMDWVPPELREDMGEIKEAINHSLPKVVELENIKADLHMHSDFNVETSHDLGLSTMVELVKKADFLGYEYISLTEHNPSQKGHNDKQIVDILKRKKEKIEELNNSFGKLDLRNMKKVFNGLEVDILPSGELPVPTEGLETLDFASVSIHSSFRLEKKTMTQRVLSALSHPKVKIYAHPTGRKLNDREGIDLDWDQIFQKCIEKNIWLEINADPSRLDLPDFLVHEAIKRRVKLTMGTDAHHLNGLDNMQWAVNVAKRGWATKDDIINTKTLNEFENLL